MGTLVRREKVEKGLAFLERRQLASGRFPVDVTFHYLDGSPVQPDEALFATAMIVYSLGFLSRTTVDLMTDRALAYLQTEMSGRGLCRYWGKNAERNGRRLHPMIPADLDDMANISYLLERRGRHVPDNKPIIALNRDRNGLFYTWLLPRAAFALRPAYWYALLSDLTLARMTVFWKTTEASYDDVDAVVNANVLLYLGNRQETRAVTDWLVKIVHDGTEAVCDKWYRDPYSFYYALSRSHHRGIWSFAGIIGTIGSRLQAACATDGKIGEHVLHTALAVNSLMNLGVFPCYFEAAIDYIERAQREDGSWDSHPLYYGGPQRSTSWGSCELTTGLCLEALHRACEYVDSLEIRCGNHGHH